MFKTFKEFCRYYSYKGECRIECPYYNCEDKISCEENYNIDKKKPITKLDMLIEVEEIKDMIRKLIKDKVF